MGSPRRPLFAEPETDLSTVADLMEECVRRLPVYDNGRRYLRAASLRPSPAAIPAASA